MTAIAPFRIDVPAAALDDLHLRLASTRWPDQLPDSPWVYGTDLDFLQDLCRHWATRFDWRGWEERLNQWPQFTTTVDGQNIHFIHARSSEPAAFPLLLTHGWPGSIVEFVDVLGPLVDPVGSGGSADDAFHVVCPSLPGYGWSGPTTARGWDAARTGRAWAELMPRLGYQRYGAQGGDWGAAVTTHLAQHDPDHVAAIHLNLLMLPFPEPDDLARAAGGDGEFYVRPDDESGYSVLQGTRPQTVAYALNDSPAGLAAWIVEKFRAWSDCGGDVESVFDRETLLANVMAYWTTGTAGSSARMYYETRAGGRRYPQGRVDVPTGYAAFPKELFRAPRWYAERYFDIVHWTEMDSGGHFAALERPTELVDDIRRFFRPFRSLA